MKSKKYYRKGKEKVVVTNRGMEIHLASYYPRKNPKNWEEEIYYALNYIGIFDSL